MKERKKTQKVHVLILPYPLQGHINPMLQFAKRLVTKGVNATLVTTVFTSKSTHTDPASSIAVETISDGFAEGGRTQADSGKAYLESLRIVGSRTLLDLIKKLGDSGRPVNAVVYDGFIPWVLDVARQCGVLGVVFFTQTCAVNSVYYHVNRGLLQLPVSGPTVSFPGLPLLEVSDTPSFVSHYGSYPEVFDMVMNQFSNVNEVDWVLFNTFYELETEVVDWLSKLWKVGTIGPTIPSMFLDKRLEGDRAYGINLFKPNTADCMNWLNGKPKNSVVYVSFGSVAELKEEQMEELAWGLKGSNCFFLWVVRASEEAKLPKTFTEEVAQKGLLVRWCSQLEVLEHEAIGCFITHCGFNSVLEALSLGVPMVGIPQWTDQPTNAKYVEDKWRTGIRAKPDVQGVVRKEVIERCIKELIEGEKGKEMKKNASKWKKLAREAMDEGGSSDKNIDEFVTKVVSTFDH
ncbi:hypothetical protein SLA2020_198690 [Shorea laevis]